jgi:hypothetical protein
VPAEAVPDLSLAQDLPRERDPQLRPTHGEHSIAVRLSLMARKLSPEALTPGEDWPELHKTYGEVLDKLRETT